MCNTQEASISLYRKLIFMKNNILILVNAMSLVYLMPCTWTLILISSLLNGFQCCCLCSVQCFSGCHCIKNITNQIDLIGIIHRLMNLLPMAGKFGGKVAEWTKPKHIIIMGS